MCGCFVVLLGAVAPRFAMVLMALFNGEIGKAFDGNNLMAFAGWLLLPYTTLTYVLVHWSQGEVVEFGWFFVVAAFGLDLMSYIGSAVRRKDIQTYSYRKV